MSLSARNQLLSGAIDPSGTNGQRLGKEIRNTTTWSKPSELDDSNTLAIYYETPAHLRNITRVKGDARKQLAFDEQTLSELKGLVFFLLSQHRELLQVDKVTTVAAKNTLCSVCNTFIPFLTPGAQEEILNTKFLDSHGAANTHARGWLIFQLVLEMRLHVVHRLEQDPRWLGRIPVTIQEAFIDGTMPDIDMFDYDEISAQLQGDRDAEGFSNISSTIVSTENSIFDMSVENECLDEDLNVEDELIPSSQETSLQFTLGNQTSPENNEDNLFRDTGIDINDHRVSAADSHEQPNSNRRIRVSLFLAFVLFTAIFVGFNGEGRRAITTR
ncbi:hypothetical protein TWF718_005779 [Orbilia javanica]|uniref:Uncharacterized protein n=1 Tax=Orbilia javanica TaxID=47235 RepID=A0AAN8MSF1_9PEZI